MLTEDYIINNEETKKCINLFNFIVRVHNSILLYFRYANDVKNESWFSTTLKTFGIQY